MRLGLVTDVHSHPAELRAALARFRDRGVDRVVAIGDTVDAFGHTGGAGEVAELLRDCGAVGVWGNHDFTLCRDVPDAARRRFPPVVFDVLAGMEPRLVVGECHFSHKEASVDPHDVVQLWDVSDDGPLDLAGRAALGLAAEGSRWQFVGHYHRWWAGTPGEDGSRPTGAGSGGEGGGPVGWDGSGPLRFDPGRRYFVVVAAVCDGWCGVLDADRGELEPLRCGPA